MSLGVVDIENVDASIVDSMAQFEPWNIEDKHLYELYDAIKDQIPDDYDKNCIRLSGRQIFIRNRPHKRPDKPRMIASSKIEFIEKWDPEDLFLITVDQHFFIEQNWHQQEKALERWQKEIKENIKIYTNYFQSFEFEIYQRDRWPLEKDPMFKPKQPRIRIDMQYIDEDSDIKKISMPKDEWTVSYFMIEKSIEGEKLEQIVKRIIGNQNENICRPGILILVREKPEYSHLTHAMNMMYKASVAMATADAGWNINEIFLNAIWNEFGNQVHSRMHEYLVPNYEDDFGCGVTIRNQMEKWDGIEDAPQFYKQLSEWYNIMTDPEIFLNKKPNVWPDLRANIRGVREGIINFLVFVFENMDGEIGNGLVTYEGESVYNFLRRNHPEIKDEKNNPYNWDKKMRSLLITMLTKPTQEEKDEGMTVRPMFRKILEYYHRNISKRFSLEFKKYNDSPHDWAFGNEYQEITGESIRNILKSLSDHGCFQKLNIVERKMQKEPHIGDNPDTEVKQLMQRGVEVKGLFYLVRYNEIKDFLDALHLVLEDSKGITKEYLERLFELRLRGGDTGE